MGLFSKLFGTKNKEKEPDNTRLIMLIQKYWSDHTNNKAYTDVISELMNGNAYLMLPSEKSDDVLPNEWVTAEKDTEIKLSTLFDLDGLKVLGAFTDEAAMVTWAKQPVPYTSMRSQDVLKLAQKNGIDRIVINSNQPTMFVLERNKADVKAHEIKEDTTVQLGTPNKPLDNKIILKLVENFKKNDTIEEVYHYGQMKDGEFSLVLGFKLKTNSENATTAAINTVQNALQNETIDQLLDLFFIVDERWYRDIQNISNALIYKR